MGSQEMEFGLSFSILQYRTHCTAQTPASNTFFNLHKSILQFAQIHFAILTATCAFPASQLSAVAARGKWAGPGMVGPPLINTQVHSTSLPAHKMLPGVIASRSCQCRKNLTSRQGNKAGSCQKLIRIQAFLT